MFKKIAFTAAGLGLLASPLIASAQIALPTDCSSNPTVACLQQEIQELVLILTQLLANRYQPTQPVNPPYTYQPSATIDQSSLSASTGGKDAAVVTITGEASNVQQLDLSINTGLGTHLSTVVSGHWSDTFAAVPPGTYPLQVIDNDPGSNNGIVLVSGTLTVTGGNSLIPHIDSTSAKAAADLQVDAGGQVDINGENLATPDSTHVFIGGIDATVTWTSDSMVTANVPTSLTPGQSYDLYVTNQYGTSNTVRVQVLSVLGTAGSLIAINPTPISYSIVAGASTGVTVGSFALQPSGENMSLQQIGLYMLAQQASPSDVMRAYVYQGSTLVGTAIFSGSSTGACPPGFTGIPVGGCYFATTTISSSGALAQNTQTNFTMKVDVAPIGIGASGTPGDYIVMGLSDAEALGLNSGSIVHSGSAPSQVGVRIFRSYPTVASVTLGSPTVSAGANQILMRYSITASAAGPVGILYQTFNSSLTNANLTNLQLYGFIDSAFSRPISGTLNGQVGATECTSDCPGSPLVFAFQLAGSPFEFEIPAGSTYYFEVVGSVIPTASNFSVATTLLGDSSYVFPQASGQGHFVWSPNDNGTTQFSTSDWTNGYGVAGLPSIGITQTVTGIGSPTPPQPTLIGSLDIQANSMEASTTIQYGASATISWTSSGMTACGIAPSGPSPWAGNFGLSGSKSTGPLTQTITYTLQCTPSNGGNFVQTSVTVNVIPAPTPPAPSCPPGTLLLNNQCSAMTIIRANSSATIGQVGNNYYVLPAGSAPVELMYQNAPVTVGEFAGWTPIGAAAANGDFYIAWQNTNGTYTVWIASVTVGGSFYIGNSFGAVQPNDPQLESIETTFGQDLNGDGVIGVPPPAPALTPQGGGRSQSLPVGDSSGSASDNAANLANALTALQAALQTLLAQLK